MIKRKAHFVRGGFCFSGVQNLLDKALGLGHFSAMIELSETHSLETFKFDIHYVAPEGPVTRLLFVFPGADYSYLGPFLYYPTQRVTKWQTAVVTADYDFTTWAETMTVSQGEALAFAVAETMRFALAKHPNVEEFLFLGKSLGAEALLEAESILLQRNHTVKSAKFVFLTPIWNNNDIVTDMGGLPYPALYIIGDKDPYYSQKVVDFLKSRGKKNIFLIIPGANHELEISENFDASVFAQQQIIDAIVEFQKRPKPGAETAAASGKAAAAVGAAGAVGGAAKAVGSADAADDDGDEWEEDGSDDDEWDDGE